MEETSNWLKDYAPLAAATAAIAIPLFQYFTSLPKTQLEIKKLQREIEKLSENSKTNSDSISEIQKVLIEQLPMYDDESVVYNNTSGNLGHDFVGTGGYIYNGGKPVNGVGVGTLSFLEKGIINIERENQDGRFELYLRRYLVGTKTSEVIPKDKTDDRPKRFRVSCEVRTIDGEHTVRFVMRNRENKKWIANSVSHRITSPDWKRIEGYFTIPPLIEAELRVDDEGVSTVPSTLQIRKFLLTQRVSE